jgi:hypothetical protein
MTRGSRRRYGENARSGSTRSIPFVAGISTTLVNPVTLTTNTAATTQLGIQMGQFVTSAHSAFEIKTSGGGLLLDEPPDGGLRCAPGYDIRVYNAKGDADYAAIRSPATDISPHLELPDAGSGSGRIGIWGGQGVPSTSTIGGTAATGDLYFRQRTAGAQVCYICTTGGNPGTWAQVI